MPSAYSTLRIVRLALATAVAPIASTGSLLSHGFQSRAATGNGSSMQPLLSFTVVNTTQRNNNASLDNPGLLKFRGLNAFSRTISEVPLASWVHTRSQWPFVPRHTWKRCEIVVKKF